MPNLEHTREVLIVEDDMIISMVLERMIEKAGCHVAAKVTTGEKAIDLALDLSPDLILMDIQLEGKIDGITAMQQIRQASGVPVIYVTGNSDQYFQSRAKKTDYISYLVKPIQIDELKTSIQEVFSK